VYAFAPERSAREAAFARRVLELEPVRMIALARR
jgi:hypothetical protein